MAKPKIAVLGGGNAGFTFAGDLTLAGFEVNLYELPRFEESIVGVREHSGIEIAGACRSGFAKLNIVTSDLEKALKEVRVILFATPSFGHAAFAKECSGYLESGQIIVINAEYTLGSVEVANILIEEGVNLDKVTIGATNSLVYATRKYLPNRVWCGTVKAKMPFATFPAKKTMETIEFLNQIYPQDDGERGVLIPAENVLETSIGNINPLIHVPMMLLKAVNVELGEDPTLKCRDSEAYRKMRDAMNRECIAIERALGLKPQSWYYIYNHIMYPLGLFRASPEEAPEWVKPENQPGYYASGAGLNLLKMRYMTEEIPYGLVGISGIGEVISVPTPVIDSAITLGSCITGIDFWNEGRTSERLGIANFSKQELLKYVNEGVT